MSARDNECIQILTEKPKRKGTHGIPWYRWKDKLTMDLKIELDVSASRKSSGRLT
jgi:hypothetical protein